MTDTVVTGANGFIGRHLMKKIDAKALRYNDIVHGHSYSARKMFFLSTYGNMAHHKDHRTMIQANIEDLITVLDRFYPDDWFCFMSSSSVLLSVQTPYSRTKRAAEEIIQSFTDIKSCIVRPYSVTGVGEQKEHLIPTLIRSCMEGEEMPFDPNPVHDFIDVEDVVDGLIRLSDDSATGIHEFGWGWPFTNEDVLEEVERQTGKKANIKKTENIRPYDNDAWYCRNKSKYFRPTKALIQIITEMVEAYKNDHGI